MYIIMSCHWFYALKFHYNILSENISISAFNIVTSLIYVIDIHNFKKFNALHFVKEKINSSIRLEL